MNFNINVINKLIYNDFYSYKPFSNYRIKNFYKNIILLDKFIYKENFLLNKFFFDIYFYEFFYKNIIINKNFIFLKKNNNISFNFFFIFNYFNLYKFII
jgi:hypothetical protein